MATYWKSQPRKFCDVCKCWLSDNKASIEFHERGKSHKEKKEKQIALLRKKSAKSYKHQQKAGQYLKQMEDAAIMQYRKDLAERGIALDETEAGFLPETSRSIRGYKFQEDVDKKDEKKHIMKIIEAKIPPKCPWTKQESPEGKTYYWNAETGKSQWDKPEGFIETGSKNPEDSKSKSQPSKSPWTEQISPEGHTYYWNSETGKSSWEKPEGFVSVSDKMTVNKPVESTTAAKGDSQNGEVPAKKPRYNPYGSWSVVQPPKPKKEIDLQLPKKLPDPASEGLIDRAALEKSFEPEQPKFNEKIIESLGDEVGSAVFKKKGSKQRSIRKRNDDD